MKINIDKVQNAVILFLRLTVVVVIFGAVWNLRWTLLFASILILISTFLPNIFEKKYKINLPLEFEFVIIIFLYTSLFLGEIHSYYTLFWWWDIVLHMGSGIALGFVGFLILYILYCQGKVRAKPIWIALFAFCFAVAIGAVWEIFEFGMDQIFGLNMQKSGLSDTMWDLIVDSIGALLTSFVGYFYIRGNKIPLFTRFLSKFSKENPRYFNDKK
ncbi:MAG: hypothetical protein KKH52_00080 [Nanoarchaeota archaeon]|nr:hypothetical protein [Nanoarchaeota archaeon]MBU1622759.1 hypothetical protein [Nanoarchaeota archaeon]MBU1973773.1 hypothetical protein [Nanoarchaeota archaeon]